MGEQLEVITEDRIDDLGRSIRITRKILKKLVIHKVPKAIAARRQWSKFGEAANHPPGPNTKTTLIGEEVFLRFSRTKDFDVDDNADPLLKVDKIRTITCRHCQGAHWTSKCPYKDMLPLLEAEKNAANPSLDASRSPLSAASAESLSSSMSNASGKYVPPSMRGREGDAPLTSSLSHKDDSATTVRVTNLSENTRESDLKTLFSYCGTVTRTFIARDYATGLCKGFAFVTFQDKQDATNAIARLNRHPYDNLILKVEWANQNKS